MSDQWIDKVLSRRMQWLLINGHQVAKKITPAVKLIPVIRGAKGAYDAAMWVGIAGAERGTFGTVAMSSPEIRDYEASAYRSGIGSYRII